MAYINGLFKTEFKLPDGTIATSQQDVNRYLKTTGAAFASDYSDAFLKRRRLENKKELRTDLFSAFIQNYKRSIWL
jgi:hypothetical protein